MPKKCFCKWDGEMMFVKTVVFNLNNYKFIRFIIIVNRLGTYLMLYIINLAKARKNITLNKYDVGILHLN